MLGISLKDGLESFLNNYCLGIELRILEPRYLMLNFPQLVCILSNDRTHS